MSKYKYYPDYGVLYPGEEISGELLDALRESDRKMKYVEYDLKSERFVSDGDTAYFLPSREDSLERLMEADKQFVDSAATPEELLMETVTIQELRRCIALLEPEERALIDALFYGGRTEREYAEALGLSQKTVNYRKHQVFVKIAKLMAI